MRHVCFISTHLSSALGYTTDIASEAEDLCHFPHKLQMKGNTFAFFQQSTKASGPFVYLTIASKFPLQVYKSEQVLDDKHAGI